MASEDKHVLKELNDKISENNVAEVKKLLNTSGLSIDEADEHGMSPLMHACYRGGREIVQLLLDQVCFLICYNF